MLPQDEISVFSVNLCISDKTVIQYFPKGVKGSSKAMVHVENKNCPINRRRERSSCEIHHVSHVEISSFQRNFVEHNFLHHQFPDMEKDGCRLNMHIQPTFGDLLRYFEQANVKNYIKLCSSIKRERRLLPAPWQSRNKYWLWYWTW